MRAKDEYTITVTEAAQRLGVHPSAVRQAVQAGRLEAIKRGGVHLLKPSSIESYRVSRRGPKPRVEHAPAVAHSANLQMARDIAREIASRPPTVALVDGPVESLVPTADAEDMIRRGEAVDARDPALRVRIGNDLRGSFRIKVIGGEVHERRRKGHHIDGFVTSFERAAIISGGKGAYRFFELEPANEDAEVKLGSFHVRGRFRVVRKENNSRRATEEWHAFKAAEQ